MGLQELAPYVASPAWHQPSAMAATIVNRDAWDRLADDLKAILDAPFKETSMIDYLACSKGANDESFDKFVQYGTEVNALDTEAIEKIADIANRLADDKAAMDAFHAKVLESQRDFKSGYRTWELWSDYKLCPAE